MLNCICLRSFRACVRFYVETRSSIGQRNVKLIPPSSVKASRSEYFVVPKSTFALMLCAHWSSIRMTHAEKSVWRELVAWNMHTKLNALSLQRDLNPGLSDWQVITSSSWSRFFPLSGLLSLVWMLSSLFLLSPSTELSGWILGRMVKNVSRIYILL